METERSFTFDDSNPECQEPVVIDAAAVSNCQLNQHVRHIVHPLFSSTSRSWPPPEYQRLSCMHCGGKCDQGMPVPIVVRVDEQKKTYYVTDITCSVACVKARIIEVNSFMMNMHCLYTGRMCQEVLGVDFATVPAPPRLRLQCFGGDLTLEQFRKDFKFVQCTKQVGLAVFTEPVSFSCEDVRCGEQKQSEAPGVSNASGTPGVSDSCLPFIQQKARGGDEAPRPIINATIRRHDKYHTLTRDKTLFEEFQATRGQDSGSI